MARPLLMAIRDLHDRVMNEPPWPLMLLFPAARFFHTEGNAALRSSRPTRGRIAGPVPEDSQCPSGVSSRGGSAPFILSPWPMSSSSVSPRHLSFWTPQVFLYGEGWGYVVS